MERKWKTAYGRDLTLEEVIGEIFAYISDVPDAEYRLYIGTDSQVHRRRTTYASAVAIHRKGKGGRYFITKNHITGKSNIHTRLIKEAEESIEIVGLLVENNIEDFIDHDDIEIHLDIGKGGKSKEVISACVGWVIGTGYKCEIKPNAAIATHVADRHCR